MTCSKCRVELDPDSRFCKHCGAPVGAANTENPPAAGPSVAPTAGDPLSAAAMAAKAGDLHRDPAMEKDVWRGRAAWRAYAGSWAIWLVASIALLVFGYRSTEPQSTVRSVLWLLVAGSAVALAVRQALVIYGLLYRLTSQRLFLYRGIITRVTDQIELVRVEDVRVRQSVIDRIVNTGDIEIISSDATDEHLFLRSILDAAHVAEHLRKNVRGARGKGSLFVENI